MRLRLDDSDGRISPRARTRSKQMAFAVEEALQRTTPRAVFERLIPNRRFGVEQTLPAGSGSGILGPLVVSDPVFEIADIEHYTPAMANRR